MPLHSLTERCWALLAHVPVITIIWTGYIAWKISHGYGMEQFENAYSHHIPITPLILTLFSIPISIGLMLMKKKSTLIFNNAQEAYYFNLWLLKFYAILCIFGAIGIVLNYRWMFLGIGFLGLCISLFCLIQSVLGIATAMRGEEFKYWYPLRKY